MLEKEPSGASPDLTQPSQPAECDARRAFSQRATSAGRGPESVAARVSYTLQFLIAVIKKLEK